MNTGCHSEHGCHPERGCHTERSEGPASFRARSFAALRITASLRMTAALITIVFSILPVTLTAQVGHDPQSSPYRDIRKGHTFTAIGGYFGGDGGDFGIAPHNGPLVGGRYDIRTADVIQVGIGITYGSLERFIVNPFVTLANRVSGPVQQDVIFADLNVQFNMTGGKTWHHLAPFIGFGGGFASASDTTGDASGFNFGSELYLSPSIGFRVFLGHRLYSRGDARATFWKLD